MSNAIHGVRGVMDMIVVSVAYLEFELYLDLEY